MKLKVKNYESLIRDTSNRAILNTDESALKRHNLKMEQIRKQKEYEEQINTLKQEISEIKLMLRELINGSNK